MAGKLSRRDLARYVADQLAKGVSLSLVSRQLAGYLIDNRRTGEQALIIRDVATILADAHGHATGTLTSAHKLSDSALAMIEQYIKNQTGAKSTALDAEVDEAVLGGVRLELPGLKLDTTIAHQLNVLKTQYKKA